MVREVTHPFFHRMPGEANPDIKAWCALTPAQHELGTIISVPSLNGRVLQLAIKPNSSVVANRGTKTMKGEGFYVINASPGRVGARGDMIIEFRVMSHLEAWLKKGDRMRWAKLVGYTVGGVGMAWLGLNALAWALDIDFADLMDVPDQLLLHEFPGSYGLLGQVVGKLYPRFKIPRGVLRDWAPPGLGKQAAKMGFASVAPPRFGRRR